MLVISRQRTEAITIGDDIRVTVRAVASDHVVLAVEYHEDGGIIKRSCSLEQDDKVEIPPDASVGVIDIRGDVVRLAIEVPQGTAVHRAEVRAAIQRENAEAAMIREAVTQEPEKPMKNKRSATAMPTVELKVDQSLAIGDGLKLTLTDADASGARLMVDGELIGGPDDGLRVREARELAVGNAFQIGTQVTVTLAGTKETTATFTLICPTHLPVRKV